MHITDILSFSTLRLLLIFSHYDCKGQSNLLICPCAPAVAAAEDKRQLLGPLQGQTILDLAGNVAGEQLAALKGAAGDIEAKQPPSCCCHEGEEGAHVDQPQGTARVCVTGYTPTLERVVLIKTFKHTSARLGGTARMRSRPNSAEAVSLTPSPCPSLTKAFLASIINFPLQSARVQKGSTHSPGPSPHLMHFTMSFNLPTTGTSTGT